MGLYRYRYLAYTCWLVYSVLLPGLAFVNPDKEDAYISQGTYCYLPVRPIWYRLALAWGPRYLILCLIVGIYITIYIYIKMQFNKADTGLNVSTMSTSFGPSSGDVDRNTIPLRRSTSRRDRRGLPSSTHVNQSNPFRTISQQEPLESSTKPLARKQTLLGALHDKSLLPSQDNKEVNDRSHSMRKRHKAIRRQLRYMFIYPLVYLLMWIAPFINHCYFYTAKHNPPFILNCFSLCCLSLQCAVDCLVFSVREKPWRDASKPHAVPNDLPSTSNGSNLGVVEPAGNDGHLSDPNSAPARQERHWWDNITI